MHLQWMYHASYAFDLEEIKSAFISDRCIDAFILLALFLSCMTCCASCCYITAAFLFNSVERGVDGVLLNEALCIVCNGSPQSFSASDVLGSR